MYKSNFILPHNSFNEFDLKKESYVKADQVYYFDKNKIDYYIIGSLKGEYLISLLKLMLSLSLTGKLKQITNNITWL